MSAEISFSQMPWPRPLAEALQPCGEYPHIRIARDYGTLRGIGRLRHQQYVATQGKRYVSAVLDADCLLELSDFSGVNIYAVDAQGLTAGMRIALMSDPHHPAAALFEQVAKSNGIDPAITLTCTRLVRDPRHNGSHAGDLLKYARWKMVSAGYRYCLIQTRAQLTKYFEQFECRPTDVWTEDHAAGRLQVMLLDTKMNPFVLGSECLVAA